jgi:hypothetical protein
MTKPYKPKYYLKQYNLKTKKWMTIGKYPTVDKIAQEMGVSYHTASNINLKRAKILNKVFKIEKIQ